MELAHQREVSAADSSCQTELALAPTRERMTLQTIVALMIAGVQKEAHLIANTLAVRKSRRVCIDALKTALAGAANGRTFRLHSVTVNGANARIRLAVHEGGQVVALVEFKIWMAVDILGLCQVDKLTNDCPKHGIYGAYKKDYDKLVAARNQWPNNQVPLTASCTLVYFINPALDAQPVQPFPEQVKAGADYLLAHPDRCQVSSAIGHFLGMLDVKRQNNLLPQVQPTSIVTQLMTTKATNYPPDTNNGAALPANEQHTITLAAVWTEIR